MPEYIRLLFGGEPAMSPKCGSADDRVIAILMHRGTGPRKDLCHALVGRLVALR